jgi:hypothetical protein
MNGVLAVPDAKIMLQLLHPKHKAQHNMGDTVDDAQAAPNGIKFAWVSGIVDLRYNEKWKDLPVELRPLVNYFGGEGEFALLGRVRRWGVVGVERSIGRSSGKPLGAILFMRGSGLEEDGETRHRGGRGVRLCEHSESKPVGQHPYTNARSVE